MPKLRFSIRTLLIVTALAAIAMWWLASPDATSQRFVTAIESGNYDLAGAMFLVDGANDMLTKWKPLNSAYALPIAPKLRDRLRGRRLIRLVVTYQAPEKEIMGYFLLEADQRGIHSTNKRPITPAKR